MVWSSGGTAWAMVTGSMGAVPQGQFCYEREFHEHEFASARTLDSYFQYWRTILSPCQVVATPVVGLATSISWVSSSVSRRVWCSCALTTRLLTDRRVSHPLPRKGMLLPSLSRECGCHREEEQQSSTWQFHRFGEVRKRLSLRGGSSSWTPSFPLPRH